jgi:hypothetical protein
VISLIPSRLTATLPRTLDAPVRQLEGEQTRREQFFTCGAAATASLKTLFFLFNAEDAVPFYSSPFFFLHYINKKKQYYNKKNERTLTWHTDRFTGTAF